MSRNDSSEAFMLRVLQKSFPEELGGLTEDNHQQKPDFQDLTAGVGVEATIAQHGDNRMMEAHAKFKKLEDQRVSRKEDAGLRGLGMTPYYQNGVLVDACEFFWEGDSYPAIEAAIINKLEKLNNGNYKVVPDVRLAIKDCLDVQQPEMLVDTIRHAFAKFDTRGLGTSHFTHIYVIPDMQNCVFDYIVDTDTIEVRPFIY